MIPAIGIMVAAYTLVRLAELISRTDRHIAIKILAGVGMLVIILMAMDLVSAGTKQEVSPPFSTGL